jgi:hypothetical protein
MSDIPSGEYQDLRRNGEHYTGDMPSTIAYERSLPDRVQNNLVVVESELSDLDLDISGYELFGVETTGIGDFYDGRNHDFDQVVLDISSSSLIQEEIIDSDLEEHRCLDTGYSEFLEPEAYGHKTIFGHDETFIEVDAFGDRNTKVIVDYNFHGFGDIDGVEAMDDPEISFSESKWSLDKLANVANINIKDIDTLTWLDSQIEDGKYDFSIRGKAANPSISSSVKSEDGYERIIACIEPKDVIEQISAQANQREDMDIETMIVGHAYHNTDERFINPESNQTVPIQITENLKNTEPV